MKLPCLSLWEPWATLVVDGRKPIETRFWRQCPPKFLGKTIVIHAALKRDKWTDATARHFGYDPDRLPYGAGIGTVNLTGTRRLTLEDEDFALCECAGKLGLLLRSPLKFVNPVPMRGQQGFWYEEIPDGSMRFVPHNADFDKAEETKPEGVLAFPAPRP
jgi:hypothetical protein